MAIPIIGYECSWDTERRLGCILLSVHGALRDLHSLQAADFLAALAVLKEPSAYVDIGPGDACVLSSVTSGPRTLETAAWGSSPGIAREASRLFAFHTQTLQPSAKTVTGVCQEEWPVDKNNCSGFVKDVAAVFGIGLTGQADDIVDQIQNAGSGWAVLGDGIAAADAAVRGSFVIAGLKGKDHHSAALHGHVAVVVPGPLAKGKYPSAFWGSLGCEQRAPGACEIGRFNTINFAWTTEDRDRVVYAARTL